ncbi:MAG TPA: protein kinase [Thermoanaerobaculia bacterium]|nr:protein kinase [Thermoanaerobaculia bacterium]
MTLASGSRLGPYEIVASIGAGGMGQVYRGRDTRLERQIAIKVLSPHLSGDSDFRLRFEREARVISALNHPHICTVHDVGESDGRGFLVMELCEGESLADRLTRGPLPVDQILLYGTQIADALDRAHRSGIVHRDLKPGNVMITKGGAKLLDFGLAKPSVVVGSGSHPPVSKQPAGPSVFDQATHQRPLTAEGSIVGTFQYMAPEQFEGQEADARSDIFAFGCLLYEMATGKRAFEGKTRASLIASILEREPVPISDVQPLIPPALQRLIKTALAKDPDDRWQSAHDVLLELRWIGEAGSQAGVAAPVVRRRKTRERVAWSLAAVAGVLAVAAGTLLVRDYVQPQQTLAVNLTANSGTTLSLGGADSGSLTISPNGRLVTFAARGADGKTMLYVRDLSSPAARPLSGTEGAQFPFWSPDSRSLAFFSDGKLRKIPVAGGPPLALAGTQVNPRAGSWNEEGVILFSPFSLSTIHKVPAAGGPATAVTTLGAGETTHRWASFLPDGDHFLYLAASHSAATDDELNAIYVSSLSGMKPKLLLRARSNAMVAGGHLLYVRDRVLMAQKIDLKALELEGDPVPIASGLQYDSGFFRGAFAVSEEGTLVYRTGAADSMTQLAWYDRKGLKLAEVGEPASWQRVVLSPDGKSVAAAIADLTSGVSTVWLYDLERNIRTRFSFGDAMGDLGPIWSPDGSQIVFSRIQKNAFDLYIKPSSGSGTEELLFSAPDVNHFADDWSLDGRYVAVSRFDPKRQRSEIVTLSMEGEKKAVPFMPSSFSVRSLTFSPDGKWATYVSAESGRNEVYAAPFPGPGGKWQVSNGGAEFATWHKGGREILYYSDEGVFAVDVTVAGSSLKLGTPQLLFKESDSVGTATRDGERFLLARRTGSAVEEPVTMITNWTSLLKK